MFATATRQEVQEATEAPAYLDYSKSKYQPPIQELEHIATDVGLSNVKGIGR
jgi:hypothetical protein